MAALVDSNSLLVCRVRLLSWFLYVMAENKCLVIENNPVTLCCCSSALTLTSLRKQMMLKNNVVLYTVLTLT